MRGRPCDANARRRFWLEARRQDGTQYVVVHRRICPTSSSIGPFRGERAVDFSADGVYFMTVKVGFKLENRVVAVNKACERAASNTVMVVL